MTMTSLLTMWLMMNVVMMILRKEKGKRIDVQQHDDLWPSHAYQENQQMRVWYVGGRRIRGVRYMISE